jgi:WD40 repeat protein
MARELTLDAANPYPGPLSFAEIHAPFFFGRGSERQALFDLIRRGGVTVVFGKSGTGKSSLLRAGLFPLLRQAEHFPIPVRLAFAPGTPPLSQQLRASITIALEQARDVEAEPPTEETTLWEFFHRQPFWGARRRLLTPVIVLDQFEEVFTLGRSDAGLAGTLAEIADLAENRVPESLASRDEASLPPGWQRQKVKLLFALREEYLPQLEDLRPLMPCIAHARFRLRDLSGEQAVEAVTLKDTATIVTVTEARKIAMKVAGLMPSRGVEATASAALGIEERLAQADVHPALLSIFCRELNERRKRQGLPSITSDLIADASDLLPAFYQRCLAGLPPAVGPYLEERLIDPEGHRTSVPIADVRQALGASREDQAIDETVVQPLVERRLLSCEPRYGTIHVELVHDVMAQVLREHKERRLLEHEQARAFRAAKRRSVVQGTIVAVLMAGAAAAWMLRRQPRVEVVHNVDMERAQSLLEAAGATNDATTRALIIAELKDRPEPPGGAQRCQELLAHPPAALILAGHRGTVNALEFSPQSDRLASASADFTASLWPIDGQSTARKILAGHAGAVEVVKFFADGRSLITGSRDGTMIVWSADGDRLKNVKAEHVFKGRGVLGAEISREQKRLLVLSDNGRIRQLDALTGEPTVGMRHSPDERGFIAAGYGANRFDIHTVSGDGSLRAWTEDGWHYHRDSSLPNEKRVAAVAFSPDNPLARFIGRATADGEVTIWKADWSTPPWRVPAPGADNGDGQETVGTSSGPLLAFGRRALALAQGEVIRVVPVEITPGSSGIDLTKIRPLRIPGAPEPISALTCSSGQLIAAANARGQVAVWNASGALELTTNVGTTQVRALAISPNDKYLAVVGSDNQIRLWRIEKKVIPGTWRAVADFARASTSACLDSKARQTFLLEEREKAELHAARCLKERGLESPPENGPSLEPFAQRMKGPEGDDQYTLGLKGLPANHVEKVTYTYYDPHLKRVNQEAGPKADFAIQLDSRNCATWVGARVTFRDGSSTATEFDSCQLMKNN